MKISLVVLAMVAVFFGILTSANANVEQLKVYKKAFDDKPKCIHCPVDEKPKKDSGLHELNEYGKKVMQAAGDETPTEETYKAIGPK